MEQILAVNGTEGLFKVDTGADVSVIPESELKKLKVTMNVTKKVLTGPCKSQLNVCGSFRAKLNTGNKTAEQLIYVVKGLRFPLLGRPAIEALNIVSVIRQVKMSADDVYERFPQVFEGLSKLDGEYNIDSERRRKTVCSHDTEEACPPPNGSSQRRINLPTGVRQWWWCQNRMARCASVSISLRRMTMFAENHISSPLSNIFSPNFMEVKFSQSLMPILASTRSNFQSRLPS